VGHKAPRSWPWARPLAGVILLVGLWELLALTAFNGQRAVPTVSSTFATMWHDSFYYQDVGVTMWEAVRGYLIGNGLAFALAAICMLVRPIEQLVLRGATATYCIPTIAVGPLFAILFSLDTTKVIMSAMSVFFVTLVGILVGFRQASATSLDLVRVYGGNAWAALRKVRLRAAVPSAFAGLSIAAPAAILGAIIGEYLGGTAGLGVVMVNSEGSLQVSRTWAVAIVSTALSGTLFGLTILASRLLAPEAAGSADDPGAFDVGPRQGWPPARWPNWLRLSATVGRRMGSLAGTLAGLLVLWVAVIKIFGLNPYFAKTPWAVWGSLFSGPQSAANSHLLFANLAVTLRDAGLGYGVGTAAAVLLAGSFILWPFANSVFMPVVVVFRAVPLVAMTPLLALIFGNGITVVAVVAGIVAFVPSVVIVHEGLRSVPPTALELMHAYSASNFTILTKVRAPYALSSLFAAAKIAVPGAVLGAVLAEWLVASTGLGREMALAITLSNFDVLWAAVAVVTAVSVAFYSLLSMFEESALSLLGR
jgi:sulfonate transport system permease protein